jgi:hypothetical protein
MPSECALIHLTRMRSQFVIYFGSHTDRLPEMTAGRQRDSRGNTRAQKFCKKLYVRESRRAGRLLNRLIRWDVRS